MFLTNAADSIFSSCSPVFRTQPESGTELAAGPWRQWRSWLSCSPWRRTRALQPDNAAWAVTDGGVVSIVCVHVLQRADDEVFVTGAVPCEAARR